jgi:signal transduction histidine kinase
MIERLRSLRVWLVGAMLATAVIAILAGNFIIARLNAASERAADRAKALSIARIVASQVQSGIATADLRALQQMLPSDQIIVVRDGATVFTGPPMASFPLELSATVPFPGGKVILRDHHAPDRGGLAQGTLEAGVIAALIIGEAWLAATVLVRTVRKPVGRAIETAERLAAGDFSARMGESGPEEFARLGRAFDSMAAQLQRADTEQKRFLADLSHEIATPVSAVSGFAFALADGSAATAAERAEAADVLTRESGRLLQLLDDVRSLNRLELTESARRERVNLGQLCAATEQRFRLAAREAKVTLHVRAGHHLSVITDPRLIETVMNNFVSNAIRYTPPGGTIEISARRRRSAVIVAVRDTGIGIPSEHLERIFGRLYRVNEARDRATGGSGLGLAIARSAAQSIGGRIEVESTPGAGSEFRLVLASATLVSAPGGGHSPSASGMERQGHWSRCARTTVAANGSGVAVNGFAGHIQSPDTRLWGPGGGMGSEHLPQPAIGRRAGWGRRGEGRRRPG